MSINTIGVIGAGVMGSGIAQVAATNGISVLLLDVSERAVKKGIEAVEGRLNRGGDPRRTNAKWVIAIPERSSLTVTFCSPRGASTCMIRQFGF